MKVHGLVDSSISVFVGPLEGQRSFIVMADVAHDFAMEIALGVEDATGDEIPLDFREPDLDLIEPRGVGRGIMEFDVGVGAQEVFDGFGFMSRKIVSDDMDGNLGRLSGDQLAEKLDKFSAGVAVGCFAEDFARGGVQGRIERKGAMAKVFKSVTFGPPWRKGQDGVQTVQGLNGALFIDTENRCVGRRLQVEPNDCGRLLLEFRVIADHVAATPVRLQSRLGPHPGHPHMVYPEGRAQLAAAPMGGTIEGLTVQSPIDDPSFELLDSFTGRTSTMPTPESSHTLLLKARPPHSHGIDAATLLSADRPQTQRTRSQAQDNPRSTSILRAHTTTATHPLKFTTFGGTQNDSFSHASKHSLSIS